MEFAQVLVAGEPARGENDRTGGADVDGLALADDLHAENGAVEGLFADDFRHRNARLDLDAEVLRGLREDGAVALAFRKSGDVGARIKRAEDLNDVVLELHPEAFEPGDGAVGVFAKHAHAFRVAAEVARSKRLLHVVFRRILDALARLAHRVGGIHEALGNQGVAAREGELFKDDDVLRARLRGLDGSGHAGAARTDHDDFVGLVPLDAFGRFSTGKAGCCGERRTGTGHAKNAAAIEVRGHLFSPSFGLVPEELF